MRFFYSKICLHTKEEKTFWYASLFYKADYFSKIVNKIPNYVYKKEKNKSRKTLENTVFLFRIMM